jgi:glutamate formiminotransferase
MQLIECVPNFSSADPAVVQQLAKALSSFPPARLLHIDSSNEAKRTVFTLAGPPDVVLQALTSAIQAAIDLIDIRGLAGIHPFIGAADVVPFVALAGISSQELLPKVDTWAGQMAERHHCPIHLYEFSARSEERRDLAFLRKGGMAALAERLLTPSGRPDWGPTWPHPTAGAMVCGVRPLLVALNINLACKELAIAQAIAARLRALRKQTPSPLPGIKAIGWKLPQSGMVQVSTNITEPQRLNIETLLGQVAALAKENGTRTEGCELIGLLPMVQLVPSWRSGMDLATARWAASSKAEELGLSSTKPFKAEAHILECALAAAQLLPEDPFAFASYDAG